MRDVGKVWRAANWVACGVVIALLIAAAARSVRHERLSPPDLLAREQIVADVQARLGVTLEDFRAREALREALSNATVITSLGPNGPVARPGFQVGDRILHPRLDFVCRPFRCRGSGLAV